MKYHLCTSIVIAIASGCAGGSWPGNSSPPFALNGTFDGSIPPKPLCEITSPKTDAALKPRDKLTYKFQVTLSDKKLLPSAIHVELKDQRKRPFGDDEGSRPEFMENDLYGFCGTIRSPRKTGTYYLEIQLIYNTADNQKKLGKSVTKPPVVYSYKGPIVQVNP